MAESKIYGYEDGTLDSVIKATDTAIQEMEAVNRQVLDISGQLPVVNDSTSGLKLAARFGDWYYEFGQVVGALRDLNGKATELLAHNRAVASDTADAG